MTTRTISDGPPYEPHEITGNASLDADIERAYRVFGNIVARANMDVDDRARLPVMVLGCIHNLTLEVQRLSERGQR